MSECPQVERVSAYHDGELPEAVRREMAAHLAVCPQCAAELARLAKLSSLFAAEPAAQLSAEGLQELHEYADTLHSCGVYRLVRACAAVAAAVLIACSAALIFQNPPAAAPVADGPSVLGNSADPITGQGDMLASAWIGQDVSDEEEP